MELKKNKKILKGIGENTLRQMQNRARLIKTGKNPIVYEPVIFPKVDYELFFDIEDDPTQEYVYLHGVVERSFRGERYLDFTAREFSEAQEQIAWKNFWDYIGTLPLDNYAVYYYSSHEKTTYKKLQKKYPHIITAEKLQEFFEHPNVIDLYPIVLSKTDWPLPSYSLKNLAVYLGFKWRDETPSGALSIQWFNEYLAKKDSMLLQRILLYNEDDCKATRVLKDGLIEWSHFYFKATE